MIILPIYWIGFGLDLPSNKLKKQKGNPKSDSGTGMGLHRPLVVAGPSGSGKSTLLKLLFQDHPKDFGFSISREIHEYGCIYSYRVTLYANFTQVCMYAVNINTVNMKSRKPL